MGHRIYDRAYNSAVPATDNLSVIRQYLEAISSKVPVQELLRFFSPSIVFEEMPNRLKPQGGRSGLAEMRQNYERGLQIVASQHYDVRSSIAEGDMVVVEVVWTGKIAMAVGHLPAGAEMRAQCAFVFEFQDGKIARQRNYDCYDAF